MNQEKKKSIKAFIERNSGNKKQVKYKEVLIKQIQKSLEKIDCVKLSKVRIFY